jgi:uncharacterized protein (DUF2147 family)
MNRLSGLPQRALARLLLVACVVGSGAALAQSPNQNSPVGVWQTIDDHTGEPKALVRIGVDPDGTLSGKILTGLGAEHDPTRRCSACTDARKDQLLQGMVIMNGLKQDGADWDGGEILDPENGKLYRCKIRLENGGRDLIVRGYIGFSLIGRSQTWHRDTGAQ